MINAGKDLRLVERNSLGGRQGSAAIEVVRSGLALLHDNRPTIGIDSTWNARQVPIFCPNNPLENVAGEDKKLLAIFFFRLYN